MDEQTMVEVRGILERLADGETVHLGSFSDNGEETTPADRHAEVLRELADGLPAAA